MKKEIEVLEQYERIIIVDGECYSDIPKIIENDTFNIFTTLRLTLSDADFIESFSKKIIVKRINFDKGFIYIQEENNDWRNVANSFEALHNDKIKSMPKTKETLQCDI